MLEDITRTLGSNKIRRMIFATAFPILGKVFKCR